MRERVLGDCPFLSTPRVNPVVGVYLQIFMSATKYVRVPEFMYNLSGDYDVIHFIKTAQKLPSCTTRVFIPLHSRNSERVGLICHIDYASD